MMQRDEMHPGFDAALRGVIIRIRDRYFLWSTIADAPLSLGMERAEFAAWYLENVDCAVADRLEMRLARADKGGELGTSSVDCDAAGDIACNRAGPNETRLSIDELYNYQLPR